LQYVPNKYKRICVPFMLYVSEKIKTSQNKLSWKKLLTQNQEKTLLLVTKMPLQQSQYAGASYTSTKRRTRDDKSHTTAKQRCIWSCEICGHAKNKDHADFCEICKQKGPITKFGVNLGGDSYLCAVHSARPPQHVDLFKATLVKDGKVNEWVLDGTQDNHLSNRMIRTLIREIGLTQKIRDEIVMKLSEVLRIDYPLPDDIAEAHENAAVLAEKLELYRQEEVKEAAGEQ